MSNFAKFLVSIDGFESSDFVVTRFSGADAVGMPYRFGIDFQISETSPPSRAPTVETILGKTCRFELIRDGSDEVAAYHGIVKEFNIHHRSKTVYTIQLVPRLQLLSLNINNRVFQKLPVIDIVKKIIQDAGLERYCNFRYELEQNYQPIVFCVQYQETDLNFISRLLEYNGIWYYFESDDEAKKDTVVITDSFSKFPSKIIKVPFVENTGFSETSTSIDGSGFGESIYSLTSKNSLYPKRVMLRNQNYRTPESATEGFCEVKDGNDVWGSVYEYGGAFKNMDDASCQASLYMKRLQVENLRTEGQSGCKILRAGRLISVEPGMGNFLLTSVTHHGGVKEHDNDDNHEHAYNNIFNCIDTTTRSYAPPLRATMPRIDGLITAPVEALGEGYPTLNELGSYRVKMPFDSAKTAAYGSSKDIRLAQPSGGPEYGIHFPSKAGAEMVIACVDGNPDKPLGLGFVPNMGARSLVTNENKHLNIMRTWGGNTLIMDDIDNRQSVKMSTPGERYLELHDGEKLVRVKSENCELLFNDVEKIARIDAGEYSISGDYSEDRSAISIKTKNKSMIEMDDKNDTIAFQSAGEEGGKKINNVTLNGNEKSIALESADNTLIVNGKDKKITMESGDSKVVIDGSSNSVTLDAKTVINIKAGGKLSVDVKKDINIKSGGKLVIDAKGGVFTKGNNIEFSAAGAGTTGSSNNQATQNLQNNTTAAVATTGVVNTEAAVGSEEVTTNAGEHEKIMATNENEGITTTNTINTEDENDTEPKVIKIYWVYWNGEKYVELEEDCESRFYVDLTLVVETKNYKDGDSVEVTIENDNGQHFFDDTLELKLNGIVSKDKIVFEDILKKYTSDHCLTGRK